MPALARLYDALKARRNIGQLIRAAREEQGFTAAALAEALGVPPSRVSEWEQGRSLGRGKGKRMPEPRIEVLEKIAALLWEEVSDPTDRMLREFGL